MKARYFCENCGTEVSAGAPSCPSCGRAFTAVRCPKCGFEGNASAFTAGCPSCGYLEKPAKPVGDAAAPRVRSPQAPKPRPRVFSSLFYRVSAVVLIALVVVLLAILLFKT